MLTLHMREQSTYAALQRSTVDIIPTKLANRARSVFMTIHFDECKSSIRLKASLLNKPKVLKQRDQVVLGRVWRQIANITSGLPLRSLLSHHFVTLETMSWKVMMSIRSRGSHPHRRHCLLLRDRGLAFLICPVAPYRTRSKPLAIHGAQSLLGFTAISICHKAVSARTTSLHVPHDTRFRDRAKS